jgi:choline dehydrogenase-like flavoprotein
MKADVADVLIIGAGTAGGIAAKHLAEAGFKVVCLEQGQWPDINDMPGDKPEYELTSAKKWHADPNIRQKPEDYPIDYSEHEGTLNSYSAVGGTSVIWCQCWSRLLPSDFRVRSLDGVADDWPISYEELTPFYEAVERELGVSGLAGNPAYPPGYTPPLPPFPINKAGRKMAQGLNRLGWHWWPGYVGCPSREHGVQKQCVRYGVCRMGCKEGSKGSTDVTHFPAAQKCGARIVTGARVSRITLDAKGLANGAVYIREGKEYFQPAASVVMAASGVGTPRLLLMSTSNRFPDGLANSSGLVGKRLMLHPYQSVVGVYEDFLDDWLGPVGETIESMQFYKTDNSRGFVGGMKWALQATFGPMWKVSRYEQKGHGATAGKGFRPWELWGEPFATKMIESNGHMLEWTMHPADLPEETNYVSLSPELVDSDGLPSPKIHYKISENTRRMVDFNLARAIEAHEAAGAKEAWVVARYLASGHHTGTTKMGDDPRTSVVDRWGRSHDVPNLYVIDGSVFPTCGAVNVTATICALAKRTATYIVEHARQQEVGA